MHDTRAQIVLVCPHGEAQSRSSYSCRLLEETPNCNKGRSAVLGLKQRDFAEGSTSQYPPKVSAGSAARMRTFGVVGAVRTTTGQVPRGH